MSSIDPAELEVCLRVLAQVEDLPAEHDDAVRVRRATAKIFKAAKKFRKTERKAAIVANDRAVTALTATGSPDRIDDETQGLPLVSTAQGATAGTLLRARSCYTCRTRFVEVDAFYHNLCPACAAFNHGKRDARTDLTGRNALLTGGRAKIGMYIALRLLRDGAHTTITTRFPKDAARRFASMPDAADWIDRLKIVGIDLRDPAQVLALADEVASRGPLDVLINNAAQTVRRSANAYTPLANAEHEALTGDARRPELISFGGHGQLALPGTAVPEAHSVTTLALMAGSKDIDAGGLVPDTAPVNSWIQNVDEVDPVELLEVQLCNSTAPFLLISRLRASMAKSSYRRKYVVNVSAMEGQFSRAYKGSGHPHTNMAKAALNMLTRTSAEEMLQADGILMTAVDTGWITDERPHPMKMRLAEEGFHAPLDLVDGAARVYDPIVRGEAGEDLYGCFLKDYAPSPW